MPEDRSLSFDFTVRATPAAGPATESSERQAAPAATPAGTPPASRASETAGPDEARPLSVAELDRVIRDALDDAFRGAVWVDGEVADARSAPSGHLYFCLKDEREEATIDVVVYRSNVTPRMRLLCVDGARLRLRGRPTFWAPKGRLQLVADRLQPTGRGALLEALERLKAKLAAEGLFAPERKRRLPGEPRVIGVVTSPSGAVIHDICRVAFRRGGARILLAAAQVQGPGSADAICRAIAQLRRVREVDVIVLGRGGGSSDDLGAFNDEAVVRAVAACPVPVVSAVGHDVDVTLVDFAADARAATPSQAAELVVPDRRARRELLRRTRLHLARAMHGRLGRDRVTLVHAARRLGDPRLAIAAHQQTLDDRLARLAARLRACARRGRDSLARAQQRLAYVHPRAVIARERAQLSRASDRLLGLRTSLVERRAITLQRSTLRLDALSPLRVLARGYAIATRGDGRAIRSPADVAPGDAMHLRVRDGAIEANVVRVDRAESEG